MTNIYIMNIEDKFFEPILHLYHQCKTDSEKVKCMFYWTKGIEFYYNECCIIEFIEKNVLRKKIKGNLCINTGVFFCRQCSKYLKDDEETLKIIHSLTNKDKHMFKFNIN